MKSARNWGRLGMRYEQELLSNMSFVPFGDLLLEPLRNGLTKPKAVRGDGVKMIGMGEIFANSRIGAISMSRVPVTEKELSNNCIKNGDILFARQSLALEGAGKCSIVIDVTEETVFESHLIRARIDSSKANPYFVYYYFNSYVGKEHIKTIVEQVAAAGIRGSDLVRLKVPCPDLETQDRIAAILSALDEKIAINRAINDNLMQQAQAIFANEFLSLDTLPEGWKQASLIDIADYLNGLAMQKYRPTADESGIPVLKIKELRQGCCDDNSELCSPSIKSDYIIHDGDVIFSWSGSLLVDLWCGGICGLNQHLFKVTSSKYDKWFYCAWTKHHLDRFVAVAADKATTMGHIKRDELAKAEVLIPNEADYNRIGALLQPIYEMIISNRIENKKLAATRDTLLPKLMNGEIDMSEVDYE